MFFWKFPEEWLEDTRDGVPFWHLTEPPTGYPHNPPAKSREAELVTRLKIFKLKFKYYVENGFIDLVIPRFSVVKVVENGVVTDIHVVWNIAA